MLLLEVAPRRNKCKFAHDCNYASTDELQPQCPAMLEIHSFLDLEGLFVQFGRLELC